MLLLIGCAAANPPIVIDGEFNDWTDEAATATDPAGDAPPDAFADFEFIGATADADYVHLLVDFGRPVNVQRLPGSAVILLDVDGNPNTGRTMHHLPGADLAVILTAPNARDPEQRGMGVGVESATWKPGPVHAHPPSGMITPYAIGFTFGPTYQSRVVEFRIRRGAEIPRTPDLFTAGQFSAAIVAFDTDRNVLDSAGPVTCELPAPAATQTTSDSGADPVGESPLKRAPNTVARIVSWNVEYSALLRDPANFVPVFKSLDPDILLLQELTDDTTEHHLAELLNQHLGSPDRTWTAFIGAGGGNLRCAVASRLPMEPIESLRLLEYRDDPNRTLRQAAAVVTIEGRPLLALSIHLRCCGDADSYEERVRLMEVNVLHEALRGALSTGEIDGLIIGGDFNLVGGRAPLVRLADGLDRDGSTLTPVQPMQLDGRSNATWSDPDQPFVPGRLDYVLYSDSTMETVRAFVFDAADLPRRMARTLRIDPEMTARASDHLPVVVDCTWSNAQENAGQ